MNLIEYLSASSISDVALFLRCLLDRHPILISGKSEQEIEEFMNELNNLVSFRNSMIFYTDFVEINDYNNLLENEENDFDVQRNIFLCYPFAIEKALETFNQLNYWILGCVNEPIDYLVKVKECLYHQQKFFLNVELHKDQIKTQIEGIEFPNIDISFEKWLYNNAIRNTEISIEKMKRVIAKKIDIKKIPQDIFLSIMNFEYEEKELKLNLIKKEIQDFFQATKRTFNILNRMKNLEKFNLKSKISTKTLFNTIAYDKASIDRILCFVDVEWRNHYNNFLESKKISNFVDTFESLWG